MLQDKQLKANLSCVDSLRSISDIYPGNLETPQGRLKHALKIIAMVKI